MNKMTPENYTSDKKVLCYIPLRMGCVIIGFCTIFGQGLYFFGMYALSYCHREDPLNNLYCPFAYYYWPALTVASVFLIVGTVRFSWKLLLPWLIVEPLSWVLEWVSLYAITRYILPFSINTSVITGLIIPFLWFLLSIFIVLFVHFYWCVWMLFSEYHDVTPNYGVAATANN